MYYSFSNFEPMQSDLEKITLVPSRLLVIKKKECVNLLEVWKEDQTFLKILGPI